ncbi:hypothetical protein CHH28_05610 [Bacterioplanes sanyensis]|uniref:Lipoprotein n=1 Tax=Bacterioplanes sanyensis TaxID=1249553 RepID=A0A222FIY7_9GAMM|nr:hypothetical protein [Bacterioplanes sanyensis]ASP38193.1 hypothetical protein CHH28_05610 [Bacterioplanes sanyensis]
MKLLFLFLAIAISGCAVKQSSINKSSESSAIQLTKDISVQNSTALDKLVTRLNWSTSEFGDHTKFSTWWCQAKDRSNQLEIVREQYKELCRSKGGIYAKPFCKTPFGTDLVIFYANIHSDGMCTDYYQKFSASIVEPLSQLESPNYLATLKSLGYLTEKQAQIAKKEENKNKHIDARNRHMKNQKFIEQLEEEVQEMQRIGTAVCKYQPSPLGIVKYYGFTEKSANNKIKIFISNAHWKDSPNGTIGGFKQTYTWDSPYNWRLCRNLK